MEFCRIFGIRTRVSSMEEAVEFICRESDRLKGEYVTFVNTHGIVMGTENQRYCRVQNRAAAAFADGAPVAWYQKKHGFFQAERVAGPDFMEEIFKVSADKGFRHYFYGSSRENLDSLYENLKKRYPGLTIAGMYAPPYEKKLKNDYQEDINRINEAKPDLIWIGLGAPKQELWMYQNRGRVCGLMLGVGAGFDFHAGAVKRAPKWMRKCGLEWFYRLLQEPGRLGKRYLRTNMKFMELCVKEKQAQMKSGRK